MASAQDEPCPPLPPCGRRAMSDYLACILWVVAAPSICEHRLGRLESTFSAQGHSPCQRFPGPSAGLRNSWRTLLHPGLRRARAELHSKSYRSQLPPSCSHLLHLRNGSISLTHSTNVQQASATCQAQFRAQQGTDKGLTLGGFPPAGWAHSNMNKQTGCKQRSLQIR